MRKLEFGKEILYQQFSKLKNKQWNKKPFIKEMVWKSNFYHLKENKKNCQNKKSIFQTHRLNEKYWFVKEYDNIYKIFGSQLEKKYLEISSCY